MKTANLIALLITISLFLRVVAGLVALALIPLLAYGLFMQKAYGGFVIGGNNSIPIVGTSIWIGGIVLLLVFSIFGIPLKWFFPSEQSEAPDRMNEKENEEIHSSETKPL